MTDLLGTLDTLIEALGRAREGKVLRAHVELLRDQATTLLQQKAALETENAALMAENANLRQQVQALEKQRAGNPRGHHCDHCGSPDLIRVGNRPDPTFADVGIKQAVFRCRTCEKESAFTDAGPR